MARGHCRRVRQTLPAAAPDGAPDAGAIAKAFELQNAALQKQLAERTERAIVAERTAAELRQRMRQMESDMTTNERSTFDITAEMTRQYKAMQENLLQKITGLEAEIHRLKDELCTLLARLRCAGEGLPICTA